MRSPRNATLFLFLALPVPLAAFLDAGKAEASTSDFTKGPYVQDLGATSGEVRVEVDPPAPVALDFGDAGTLGRMEHKQPAAFHVFPLTGLTPKTRYVFSAQTGTSTKLGGFTTAPSNTDTDTINFLIYGDNRTDDAAHAGIVRTMTSHPADFLLNTGDLVEHGGVPGLWQRFFDIEAPLLSSECMFPTIGNHELVDRDATLYLRYFGPSPTLTAGGGSVAALIHRTFRWGMLRVLILGGFGDDISMGNEKRWLEEELRKSDSEPGVVYRIVMTHYGPWSSGPHGRNRSLHDASIVDVLRAHKVSLMLSGHDHIYERGQDGDMPYMVSGGGGAPSYEQKTKLATTRAFASARHFVDVRATTSVMTFTAVRSDGSKIEVCGLPASGGGWDCDKTAATPTPSSSTQTTSAASPNNPESKPEAAKSNCGCSTVGGRGAGAGGALFALFGLFLLGTRRYARRRCASPS